MTAARYQFSPGDVVKGFRFLGGDDTKQENWEPVNKLAREMTHQVQPERQDLMDRFLPHLERGTAEMVGGGAGATLGSALGPWGTLGGGMLGTAIGSEVSRLKQRVQGRQPPGPEYSALSAVEAPVFGRLGEVGAAGLRYGLHPGASPGAMPRLNMAELYGLPPLAPAVTGNRAQQMLWEGAGMTPGGSEIAQQWADEFGSGMRTHLRALTPDRAGSVFLAGEALQSGSKRTIDKYWRRADNYMSRVKDALGDSPPDVDLTEYALALGGPMRRYGPEQAAAYSSGKFGQRMDALQARHGIFDEKGALIGLKPVPWQEADDLRKVVGADVGAARKVGTLQDMKYTDLKAAYKGITADMEKSLQDQGNEMALKNWAQYKKFFRRGAAKVEADIDKVINSPNPEKFFNAIGSGDYRTARRAWGGVPQDVRDVVREEAVWRLGLATPGVQGGEIEGTFSVASFVTNYHKMHKNSPEMARMLYGRDKPRKQYLEDLVEIAASVKELHKVANTSRTAPIAQIMKLSQRYGGIGAVGLLFLDQSGLAAGALAGTTGTRAVASLMAKPSFIRWLAKGRQFTPVDRGWGHHITKLGGLVGLDPADEAVVEGLKGWLDSITENPNQPVEQALSAAIPPAAKNPNN